MRLVLTDNEGTLVDSIELTLEDFQNEVNRNPHGLVSELIVSPNFVEV